MSKKSMPATLAIYIAALISGASALAYEVVWSRMLVVPLGNSADATALVLAAFMLGIAAGARLLGGFADRVKSPLLLYMTLELILGAFALAMPFLISTLPELAPLRGSLEEQPMRAVARLTVSGVLVALPSLAMGATLPVLVRVFTHSRGDVERQIGLLYGANTIGAGIGAAAAGFVVIPQIGLAGTGLAAVFGSFVAAILAWGAGKLDRPVGQGTTADDAAFEGAKPNRFLAGAAIAGAAAGGFVMLSSEVLWARLLTFVFGHDTYAFSVLLFFVLTGLGLGGFLHRKLAGRDQLLVLASLLGLFCVSLIGSFWIAAWLIIDRGHDPFNIASMAAVTSSLELEFYREMLYAPILVLVPSVLSGAIFPAACSIYAQPASQAGRRVGTAALVNGAASAAGSLLTSFALVAWLGIGRTFTVLAALLGVVSLALLAGSDAARRSHKPKMLAVLPIAGLALAALAPSGLPKAMLHEAVGPKHQDFLHYEEGRTGTVSVTVNAINGEKQLFVNAVNEVTTRLVHDQSFKLLGHLGPLLHPDPQKGLMICLGAGISAGAALRHPLDVLDVVELSAAIPRAAELWENENNSALEDPALRLHLADGRHYLLSSADKYDVVMVDSTHPKAVDSWLLYTREFYDLVRSRLAGDGILVQWVPLHGLSEREFKIIVRTFQAAFPETTMWVNVGFETYGQAAYVKLVGTLEPLLIDYKELALRLREPKIARDLEPLGMDDPLEILDSFLAGPAATARWTMGLPIQTDDRPIVPYTTRYSEGRRMEAPLLLAVRSLVFPLLRRMDEKEVALRDELKTVYDAQGFLLAGMLKRAAETWPAGKKIQMFQKKAEDSRGYYTALAELYEGDPRKQFEIGSYLGNLSYPREAKKLYEKALEARPGDPRYRINLALVLADLSKADRATELLGRVIAQDPENALAHYNLGVILLDQGRPSEAIAHLKAALDTAPELIGARLSLAEAQTHVGSLARAEAELDRVIDKNPWVAAAWDLLGLVHAARNDWSRARKAHVQALTLEPYRFSAHYNLGIALQEEGRLEDAARAYQAALQIDPDDPDALNNLGLVYAGAGLYERAAESHRRALEIAPGYGRAAYNLGLAYRAQGRLGLAAEAFAAALMIEPGLIEAKEQLLQIGALEMPPQGPPTAAPAPEPLQN